MEKQVLDSLTSIKKRHQEIQEELSNPDVVSNISKYRKLTREANSIKDVVFAFTQYENHLKAIKDSKEIIKSEKDEEILAFAKEELELSEKALNPLEEEIKFLLIPKDPNDDKNVIVEIRGAAGGDEANIFAGNIFDIYKKWAVSNGMKLTSMNKNSSDSGGFSLIVFRVEGENAYSKLKFESGVHRVQRIPVTETQGRVHTSTVTVVVMPEADDDVEIEIKTSDLRIDTYRSSGAGGQSVNTTDSAVRITHVPTGIVVTSQDERSQLANRDLCLKILKTKLFDLEIQKQQEHSASFRALGGSGARSEKIRTYNYPQDRVTDHRVSLSVSLKGVLDGKINNIIESLQASEKVEKMKKAKLS